MENAIIICSRYDSSRIPGKAFAHIAGKPVIEHLIDRLYESGFPIILAIPRKDVEKYYKLHPDVYKKVYWFVGEDDNPLHRMYKAAKKYKVKHIIRVCHDKIFVDNESLKDAVNQFLCTSKHYLYSSEFTQGSGFEIISFYVLRQACVRFKDPCEHISYAIRAITKKTMNYKVRSEVKSAYRLLIDYPNDLKVLEIILTECGQDCDLKTAIKFLKSNYWLHMVNALPKITIYTCIRNGEKYFEQCLDSVTSLIKFKERCEYIIVDDSSSDHSSYLCASAEKYYPNIKWIKNPWQMGLAAGSNIALKNAEGKYIVRMDCDDYFIHKGSIEVMIKMMEEKNYDVVYPNNIYGYTHATQTGNEEHHVGGALFKTQSLNHLKFTDRLRHFDGLDLYQRAKETMNIGYLDVATFFYRQHAESMSKNNLQERQKIKMRLENRDRG